MGSQTSCKFHTGKTIVHIISIMVVANILELMEFMTTKDPIFGNIMLSIQS